MLTQLIFHFAKLVWKRMKHFPGKVIWRFCLEKMLLLKSLFVVWWYFAGIRLVTLLALWGNLYSIRLYNLFKITQPDRTQKSLHFWLCQGREFCICYSVTYVLFCFVSPFLKPYCQGCHYSELQLVTIGTWKCPRLCFPHFTTMNDIGPGNYGSETGQEMSQTSLWMTMSQTSLWNFHSIISPIICWSCVPHSLTPTSWCFSFLPLLFQFFMLSL